MRLPLNGGLKIVCSRPEGQTMTKKLIVVARPRSKIYLNPSELNLIVKLKAPKVLIRGNEINLSNYSNDQHGNLQM